MGPSGASTEGGCSRQAAPHFTEPIKQQDLRIPGRYCSTYCPSSWMRHIHGFFATLDTATLPPKGAFWQASYASYISLLVGLCILQVYPPPLPVRSSHLFGPFVSPYTHTSHLSCISLGSGCSIDPRINLPPFLGPRPSFHDWTIRKNPRPYVCRASLHEYTLSWYLFKMFCYHLFCPCAINANCSCVWFSVFPAISSFLQCTTTPWALPCTPVVRCRLRPAR